ncbi:MAG: hypothetical protein MRY57_03475 [Candidatus Pacebacteria bacterium]|nr:hypothetical protein [Candidatus Paceibacterota bacterium]
MILSDIQKEFILNAESKALGTYGDNIHVIPVSTIFINNEQIILCNYFMKNTIDNILQNPNVSLSCWSQTQGIQIKGIVTYQETGDVFSWIQNIISQKYPHRILKGVLVINPSDVYDTSLPQLL